jgi:hypothetical protein
MLSEQERAEFAERGFVWLRGAHGPFGKILCLGHGSRFALWRDCSDVTERARLDQILDAARAAISGSPAPGDGTSTRNP